MKYLILFFPLFITSCSNKTAHLKPVPSFDVDKYSGKWYEIARFDHRFERGLDEVTATYIKKESGYFEVLNEGVKQNGEKSEIVGKARLENPDLKEGLLKVSFFWFFEATYKIIYLDENYSLAVVCSDNYDYLWWLSREPKLTESQLGLLSKFSTDSGFDTSKLIFPRHTLIDELKF